MVPRINSKLDPTGLHTGHKVFTQRISTVGLVQTGTVFIDNKTVTHEAGCLVMDADP